MEGWESEGLIVALGLIQEKDNQKLNMVGKKGLGRR